MGAFKRQMEAVGDSVELAAGSIRAYRHGDIGWVADRPTFTLGDSEVAFRHTSVFMHEEGEWRIVQHHFSIGVADEAAFGDDAAKLR